MRYRLALFDVDSTLTTTEAIDLLASFSEHGAEVASITESAMKGEIDFDTALRKRVSLLSGLDVDVFNRVLSETTYSEGARSLIDSLRSKGVAVGVVSGGFYEIVEPLFEGWGFDFIRANRLEYRGGKLTGKTAGEIINRAAKFQALTDFASQAGVPISETVAIGDGSNDIEMVRGAGLGISYRGKPALRQIANEHVETLMEIERFFI
jgi:phosphoserine phosphatase